MNVVLVIFLSLCLVLSGWLLFAMIRLGFVGRSWLLFRWDRRVDNILAFARTRHGDRVLIELLKPMSWHDRCAWSAGQLLEVVAQVAACWKQLGVNKGDRVAVYKENGFDYFILSCAIIRVGAIAVPINDRVEAGVAARYLERLGATILVVDARSMSALRGHVPACVRHVVATDASGSGVVSLRSLMASVGSGEHAARCSDADRPIYVVHTSGTTGTPKGVIIKASGMVQSLRSMILFNMVSPRDAALFALPMNHQVSQLYLNGALLMGVKCIIHDDPRDEAMAQCIDRIGPSVFFAFPVTYTLMKKGQSASCAFGSVRIWGSTADACHESLQRPLVSRGRFFRDIGLPLDGSIFVDGLGSSEVGIAALLRIATPWTRKFGRRVGRKTPLGPEVKVADARGNRVADGRAGLLMVRGVSVFDGYWNSHDTFYQAVAGDWFMTGDVVMKLRGGEYMHLDRAVDVIRSASGTVHTLPIEEVLLNRPGVLDASVFGVPASGDDPELEVRYETPVAIVAFERDEAVPDPREFLAEVNMLLEPHERLGAIKVVRWQDIPLGSTGKTLKRLLRMQHEQTLTGKPVEDWTCVHCSIASV